ncbi:MAG: LLM class flavin-dependent oxidoreductase [Chloroflexi bacterium]|nr:LLM class flavin-dependent oxidoreductase [Chloroflexota bacterium]
MQRVGLIFLDRPGISEQIRLAQYAEERGFDSVWVCETRLARDAVTPLAAFATATQRVKLGAGVVNNWTRTSALMAMTFATLAELAPGRVILGIGSSWEPLAWKQGIERRKTLRAMREYVDVVRRLLALESVTLEGEVVKVRDLRLDLGHGVPQEPIGVPIYIGATGPRMMELAGEIADGILHNFFTSPQYLRRSLERARIGAERAKRSLESIDMAQMIGVSMSQDAAEARNTVRSLLAMYIGQQPHIARASGVEEDLIKRIHDKLGGWPPRPGGLEDATPLVRDSVVDLLSAAGTPEMCRQRVQGYLDAGASFPVLCPLTPNVEEIIDTFALGSSS